MVQELDPSGVDALWNKYTIKVRGFVSGPNNGGVPGVFRQDTSAVLAAIKDQLETPRRAFQYRIGATTEVRVGDGPVAGVGTALDAKLGPFPLPATVTKISVDCYAVECGVVVRLTKCDENLQGCPDNPVVSLRWGQTESFDQNWYSNLVTQGKLIVRSDLRLTADTFRPLTTPPLLPDYIRKTSRYTMSPTGTELDFYFEDQEVDRLPPFAATTATGTFTVVIGKNQIRTGTCSVDLEGPKGTSRKQLMIKAIQMCYSKLQGEGPIGVDKSPPLMWGSFKEDLFKVAVHVDMSALLMPVGSTGGGGLAGALKVAEGKVIGTIGIQMAIDGVAPPGAMLSVGIPPNGVETNLPGIAGPTRKRLEALLAAAFRDPCLCEQPPLRSPGGPYSSERLLKSVDPTPNAVATIEIGTIPEANDKSTKKDTAPYDEYMVETSVVNDNGKVHMPGTGVGATGGTGVALIGHGGLMKMIVSWVAARTGKPPVLPAYFTDNPNVVPLRGALTGKEVSTSADGNAVTFMTAGYYIYAVLNPALMQIANPVPPFMAEAVAAAALGANTSWLNLYQFVGAAGSNPFIPGQSQNGNAPQIPAGSGTVDEVPFGEPENPGWASGSGSGGSGGSGGGGYAPVVNP